MKYYFRMDGQAPSLSRLEFEALFDKRPTSTGEPNNFKAHLDLDYDTVRSICTRSALIKKTWTDETEVYKYRSPQYPGREPKDKPGFHPSMLKPKWARLLINLARLKRGNKILDPFCGTGSVLIEAHYLDLKPTGIDLDNRAIEKSVMNLDHYGIMNAKVSVGDATLLDHTFKVESFHGIVTDLPYGRSSTTGGDELKPLYYNFLKSARKVLKKGHYLVYMKPHYVNNKIPAGYEKVGQGDLYAHRGLSRRAVILRKK